MKSELFVCMLLLIGSNGHLLTESKGETCAKNESGLIVTAILNEYVDAFLPTVQKFMIGNGIDPMQLPDMTEGFNFKPLLIAYNGNLGLKKGILQNLRSLRRVGDILVSYGNAILTSKGNFGVTDLKFNYNYLAQVMGIGPTGGVSGSVSKVNMFVNIVVDFKKNQMHIQDFNVHNIGSRVVTANLNNYIDFIMPAIIKIIETTGLDPMTLPDVSERISIRPGLVTFHGDLKLTKGSLRNLKTLARAGDTIVSYGDKILKIRVDFGIKNLKIVYRYLAKIMGIGPTGGVTGVVSKLSMVVDVLIDFNRNQLELTEFKLHDLGKITVTMSGNPITDLLMNTIIRSVTNIFRNLIFNVVEKNIRNVLQDKIKELNSSIGSKAFLKALEMELE